VNARQATAGIPAASRAAPKIAWLLCGLALALISCGAAFMVLGGSSPWAMIQLAALMSSALVGGLVASRRPANPVGWFLLTFATCLSGVVFTEAYAKYGLLTEPGSLPLARAMAWPPQWLWAPGAVMILLFLPLYFPDGRLVSRRWRWVVRFAAFFSVFATNFSAFQPGDVQGTGLVNPMGLEALGSLPWVIDAVILPLWLGLLFISAASLVVRFRRSGTEQRQQIKWLALAAWVIPVWFIISPFFERRVPVVFEIGETLAFAGVPVAVGIAILKYRLYDIDLIINRTLVYGALTACVVGVYVLVVGYLGQLFHTNSDLLVSLIATGVVAVLFAPLRDRLQRGVNRLMYGEREDPYAVISRLGERLEGTLAPEAVLPTIVETVREALRLPYAAIALERDTGSEIAASAGEPVERPLRLPLAYQNDPVGELLLGRRAGEGDFSAADRRLLEDLARQAGIAAHAVRLTADLQQARERLVTTREEERRRLRRDLHDGLGPMLGSLTLKLDVADDMVEENPAAARVLLRGLKSQTQSAVADIRRLVYALRPPALDDLGLVNAIRETAAQYSAKGLRVSVDALESLPLLSAAVEAAAYRIAQEAMTNVARHAAAGECSVRLALDEETRMLDLEIRDDGDGLPPERGRGVGLFSMRERAEELGGSCIVESSPSGGTCVRAALPCTIPTADGSMKPEG
jgi:signal transduction histidine kinase